MHVHVHACVCVPVCVCVCVFTILIVTPFDLQIIIWGAQVNDDRENNQLNGSVELKA